MYRPTPRLATTARGVAQAIVVALLAAFGLLLAGAGPATAADGEPWSVATASNDLGSDRQNYNYTLSPGEQVTDGLVVANNGTSSLTLAVYAADAYTTDDGQLDLVARDGRSTGVGAWVRPGQAQVSVQPGATAAVPFTLTVPQDAGSGDHMGGIVTSLTETEADGKTVETRIGISIRLRVGAELAPALAVENLTVHHSVFPNPFGRGDATVTYTIRNTGNVILAARQSVTVSGPFGRLVARAGVIDDSPQLLPGDTWDVSVPVHGASAAPRLTATVALTPLLTDAAGSTSPLASVTAKRHAWSATWLLIIVVVVLALAAGVVLLVRRVRRRAGADRNPAPNRETATPETTTGQPAEAAARAADDPPAQSDSRESSVEVG